MMWFYTETFKCILCTVWKPKEMNSNCHRCKLFLWGKATYRDSETAFVAHTRGISWVTPCMFTALLGLTLINANQKQISLTLTHHPSWLTADCTSYISQPCASETSHMETVQKWWDCKRYVQSTHLRQRKQMISTERIYEKAFKDRTIF